MFLARRKPPLSRISSKTVILFHRITSGNAKRSVRVPLDFARVFPPGSPQIRRWPSRSHHEATRHAADHRPVCFSRTRHHGKSAFGRPQRSPSVCSRSFQLLIKPIKYRLLLGQLTASQAANSKVLASVILYVARRAVGVAPSILVRQGKRTRHRSLSSLARLFRTSGSSRCLLMK